MFVFQVATQLVGEFAGGGDHQVQRLFGVARAGQAHEEADRANMALIQFVQIKDTRFECIGHGEQHIAVAAHAFMAVEDIHIAKTQAAFENALMQRRAGKALLVTRDYIDHQHQLDRQRLLLRLGLGVGFACGLVGRSLFAARLGGHRINQNRRFVQIQTYLLRLMPLAAIISGQGIAVTAEGRFGALVAVDHTRRPKQLVVAAFFRQIGEIAFEFEADL